jgi:hypothetical protein
VAELGDHVCGREAARQRGSEGQRSRSGSAGGVDAISAGWQDGGWNGRRRSATARRRRVPHVKDALVNGHRPCCETRPVTKSEKKKRARSGRCSASGRKRSGPYTPLSLPPHPVCGPASTDLARPSPGAFCGREVGGWHAAERGGVAGWRSLQDGVR